jgi:hypothetical protein
MDGGGAALVSRLRRSDVGIPAKRIVRMPIGLALEDLIDPT